MKSKTKYLKVSWMSLEDLPLRSHLLSRRGCSAVQKALQQKVGMDSLCVGGIEGLRCSLYINIC